MNSAIDAHLLHCFIVQPVRWGTYVAYNFLFNPIETFLLVDWFYYPILFAALPYVVAITAAQYTLTSFYGGRRVRRSSNYRLHKALAYRQLGGHGII